MRAFYFGIFSGAIMGSIVSILIFNIYMEYVNDSNDIDRCESVCEQLLLPGSSYDIDDDICLCRAGYAGENYALSLEF